MKNKFKLYQQVVLSKALPEHSLQKGDVATIIEVIENKSKTGYCLELFDNNGDTLKVIIVNESDINEVKPHSVVNFRELQTH
ncbi:MAG: DUF4926 domain-containing protein [Bacteroidota bacterium]|nr:DUF4926 domain-containing protein [Bacteroidota bacterium]